MSPGVQDPIPALFELLDRWRHFPAYQLERRADIFFALYLREVMEELLEVELHPTLIPEFPLKRDLVEDTDKSSRLSFKVDYLALTRARDRVVLIELKTDGGSRRAQQDDYLQRAQQLGLGPLLRGLLEIVGAASSSNKRKYGHLLHALGELGLLELPAQLGDYLYPTPRRGLKQQLEQIGVPESLPEVEVLYVQPVRGEEDPRCIGFADVAAVVGRHEDELSQAFAARLRAWREPAGERAPGA